MLGIIEGTDKASLIGEKMHCSWDYYRHYYGAFRYWRDKPINVIEIGVLFGHSINVWLEYFSKARIVGVDINPDCSKFARERVEIRIGSQDDQQFLRSVAAEFSPSIVIDDGSHFAAHMIVSFETLFPMLAPGGIYVLEDMLYQFDYDDSRIWPYEPKSPQPESEPVWAYLSRLSMARLARISQTPLCIGAANQR